MQIRKISHDGREMIDLLFSVMRGEALPLPSPNGSKRDGRLARPSPELRVKAAEMLLDRAFGRAKEIIELMGEGSEDERRRQSMAMIKQLSVEEQEQLRMLLKTARERAERACEIPPSPPFPNASWTGPDPASTARVDTSEGA
jgi:hypothetical protein